VNGLYSSSTEEDSRTKEPSESSCTIVAKQRKLNLDELEHLPCAVPTDSVCSNYS